MRGASNWLRLVSSAGAILFTLLSLSAAEAAPNGVSIQPTNATVAAGGSVKLKLVAEPSSSGLAAWVAEVRFDPAVLTTTSRKCDPLDTPSGAAGAAGCEAVDTNADGSVDTVKVFGAVLFSNSGRGLSSRASLASIIFDAVGSGGQCSELNIRVVAFTDPAGRQTNPAAAGGQVCIEEGTISREEPAPATVSQPARGTSPADRENGAGAVENTRTSGRSSEESATSAASPTRLAQGSNTGATGGAERDDGESSGGVGVLPWLLAAIGLAVFGGGIWAVARIRR